MRILHTSDWHLGKTLERADRLFEQAQFLEELEDIAEEEAVDLILVAGDIYDTNNPPVTAENLFYSSLISLSKKGERPVVIISGNHDSPGRLTASKPFLEELGVILLGPLGQYPLPKQHPSFSILNSGEGFFEIELKGQQAVLITMPFPSEKRLNTALSEHYDEALYQEEYGRKIGMILEELSKNFRQDTINITMGHFFIAGGEESGSERNIQLGGSMAVSPAYLPPAQYTAMGHLHRPQQIHGGPENAYYSGSPIQYSKSEVGYAKSVYIAEIHPGQPAKVKKRYLKNYKPIEIWRLDSIEEAIALCGEKSGENTWVYLEIKTDRVITPSEIKEMRSLKPDILDIIPLMELSEEDFDKGYEDKTLMEDFLDFYAHVRGAEPGEETVRLFTELLERNEP